MKKTAALLTILFFCLPLEAQTTDIKRAVFAGSFYQKDSGRLAADIDGFLGKARLLPEIRENILALIAPHAGYVYSGQTAAHAYAQVRGLPYETVVIIGPSHQVAFKGCSIYLKGGFETPLGIVRVDDKLAAAIVEASGFGFNPKAFAQEHSVEVQIPFIQRALPQAKIVPIVMGFQNAATIRGLAEALAKTCSPKKVLIVASTDLSHFLSKKEAEATDSRTSSLIQAFETGSLLKKIEAGENIMCGGGPVLAALFYSEKAGRPQVEILHRSDSSAYGGEDEVVGYLAAAIYSPGNPPNGEFSLSGEEKRALLELARSSVAEFISRGSIVDYSTESPALLSQRGVFVTLRTNRALRGCIGFIESPFPLYRAVIQAAIYAATRDTRFPPVREEELSSLEFEISVLTPLKEISNPLSIQVGKHGLVISKDEKRGLLLPQVPTENGWDRNVFLEQACLKAGLPPDSWEKGARIQVFEAIVFHE